MREDAAQRRPVAWVTGGSGGIGAACARVLSAEYAVAVGYRTGKQAADRLVSSLRAEGREAVAVRTDVSDREQVFAACREITETLGAPELLVTSAGVAWYGLTQDMEQAAVEQVIGTDLCGTIYCCQAVLPEMLRRHSGCIITVASVWGERGASCETVYSAAKAGVIGFTKALAQEVGFSGIRVNCLSPGVIRTEMLNTFSPSDLQALADETPLSRLGTPEDVAQACVYLAQAEFVTGQVLSVNGGF